MICPNCKAEVEQSNYCPECGAMLVEPKIVNYCPKCQTIVKKGKFCPDCGTKLEQKSILPEKRAKDSSSKEPQHSEEEHEVDVLMRRANQFEIDNNKAMARACYKKAAAFHDLNALCRLGIDCEYDDPYTAFWYFEEAAELGHMLSQYLLAEMYAEGRGCTQSPTRAAEWYKAAADQGHEDAKIKYNAITKELKKELRKKSRPSVKPKSPNSASASITQIRLETEVLYKQLYPSITVHADVKVTNVKKNRIKCRMDFINLNNDGAPIKVKSRDPEELGVDDFLGKDYYETPAADEKTYSDFTFTAPYYILCNHNSRGTHKIAARVSVYELREKRTVLLMSNEESFTITCGRKALIGEPSYKIEKG